MAIVDSLKYCQQCKGLELYAWCLMPSHLHMIVAAEGDGNLSDVLRDFKKFTSKEIVRLIQEEPESRREWMPPPAGQDLVILTQESEVYAGKIKLYP